jgi:hypothetical protein
VRFLGNSVALYFDLQRQCRKKKGAKSPSRIHRERRGQLGLEEGAEGIIKRKKKDGGRGGRRKGAFKGARKKSLVD